MSDDNTNNMPRKRRVTALSTYQFDFHQRLSRWALKHQGTHEPGSAYELLLVIGPELRDANLSIGEIRVGIIALRKYLSGATAIACLDIYGFPDGLERELRRWRKCSDWVAELIHAHHPRRDLMMMEAYARGLFVDDECPGCESARGEIRELGRHRPVDRDACPETCSCKRSCFSMAEHRVRQLEE